MTTIIPVTLIPRRTFNFQPTLDGVIYNGAVPWGLFGQRPYLGVYTTTNSLVVYTPLVGTRDPLALAAAAWDEVGGVVNLTTELPHGYRVGTVAKLTTSGVTPDAYNGTFLMTAVDPFTLQYAQATDPGGPATALGVTCQLINLVGGFFQTSTLVYRESSGSIEVSP